MIKRHSSELLVTIAVLAFYATCATPPLYAQGARPGALLESIANSGAHVALSPTLQPAPKPPVILSVIPAGQIVVGDYLMISGTAEAGGVVYVLVNGVQAGMAIVNDRTYWQIEIKLTRTGVNTLDLTLVMHV